MTQTSLPAARASFVESDGRPTPQFYRFLETLATAQTGNASATDIAAINAQLATLQDEIDALPESSGYPKLQVTYPILSQGLLQNGFAKLALNQPGDTGTGSLLAFVKDAWGRITGTKAATITGTAGRVTVANGDASAGLPTIDLATVADTGGGSLLRIVRDAWGRVTGTSTPSTTDLAEGSNLYFTASRVLATVLAGLSTATNAAITAADSVLSAFGKLQAQITANVTTLSKKADSSAGTYSPTLTDVTNTGSSSTFTCQWLRVGDVVTVSGRLQTAAASGGVASQLDVSLPIASNFTDGGGLGGAGTSFSSTGNVPVVIFTETTNDRARFLFRPLAAESQAIGFSFTYHVQ